MAAAKPPTRRTISQWADQFRFLSPEASAEPGRWRTSRAEYQRDIMDAVSDPAVQSVVFMKSAQVGWTEILNNVIGFHIHQDPSPMLLVQPTKEIGESWSKDRLAPMLRDSPALRGLVSDAKARDGTNTLFHKAFAGGHLTIGGANSAASLASRPVRVVLFDEVDRYPASAGTEGDPIMLGRKRTNNFWNRRELLGSSPTTKGRSRIERAYEASDKRRFWVPCPHCSEPQVLKWQQVKWEDDDAETAAYHCIGCGAAWSDVDRWSAVQRGRWIAEAPFRGVAGFHISELYSPWRRLAETVQDFLDARGRPEMLKAWVNTALGETWQEAGEAPEWQRLLERREPLLAGVVPQGAMVLTAGVDNQAAPARLEIAIWAWGPGYEQWLVDTRQIPGSPGARETWDEVERILATDFPCEGGGTMRVSKWAADTGGQHTADVYAQLRRMRDPRLVPVKGVPGWNRSSPVMGPTLVDVTEGGRKIRRGLRLWTVAVDVFKAELYRRLWLQREGDAFPKGWVHLPQWCDAEHVQQLVAEQLVTVTDKKGFSRQEWQKLRANEQLDMSVYARAALSVLGSDRYGDRFWRRFTREEGPAAPVIRPDDPPPLSPAFDGVQLPPSEVPVAPAVSVTRDATPGSGRGSRYAR